MLTNEPKKKWPLTVHQMMRQGSFLLVLGFNHWLTSCSTICSAFNNEIWITFATILIKITHFSHPNKRKLSGFTCPIWFRVGSFTCTLVSLLCVYKLSQPQRLFKMGYYPKNATFVCAVWRNVFYRKIFLDATGAAMLWWLCWAVCKGRPFCICRLINDCLDYHVIARAVGPWDRRECLWCNPVDEWKM